MGLFGKIVKGVVGFVGKAVGGLVGAIFGRNDDNGERERLREEQRHLERQREQIREMQLKQDQMERTLIESQRRKREQIRAQERQRADKDAAIERERRNFRQQQEAREVESRNLRREVEASQAHARQMRREREEKEEERKDLEREGRAREAEYRRLQAEQAQRDAEAQRTRERIAQQERELREKREQEERAYKQRIDQMENEHSQLIEENKQSHLELAEMDKQLAISTDERTALELQNEEYNERLNEVTMRCKEAEEKYKELVMKELDLERRLAKITGKDPNKTVEQLRQEAVHMLGIDTINKINIGVCGSVNTGKSTLINCLRVLGPNDPGAAAVGITETTATISPYPFQERPDLVLWDIPGSDTPYFNRNSYFYSQKLYVFDFLIIMGGVSLTETDLLIAEKADEAEVPFAIVRSHCDQDLRNELRNIRQRGNRDNKETILEWMKPDFCMRINKNFVDQFPHQLQGKIRELFCVSAGELLAMAQDQPAGKYSLEEKKLIGFIGEKIRKIRFVAQN